MQWKIMISLVVFGFVSLNLVALLHARAMMRFVPTGTRTGFPEQLSSWAKLSILLTGITVPRPRNNQSPANIGLPFHDCTFDASDGLRLAAWSIPFAGSNVVVVMFHGYAGSRADLLDEAVLLHEMGLSLLLVDFRGSGESQGDRTTIGVDEARDVQAALAEAARRYPSQRVIALGQSMGAAAVLRALHTGVAAPDGIILEAPFDRMLTTVEHRFSAMKLPSWPFASLLVYWGGWLIGVDAFAHNPVDYARGVRSPALVISGMLDPRVHPAEAVAVHDALSGWKRVAIFPDSGHLAYVAKYQDKWKAVVAELVDAATPPAAKPKPSSRTSPTG